MHTKRITERGQALILIALAMVGMVAMVGLAIDGSAKFSDQRHAQNAADTAAIAAALAKINAITANQSNTPAACPPPSGTTPSSVCNALRLAGWSRAASNGYNNNLTTNTVVIHSPPVSGPYAGDADYVHVVITSTINTTFTRVIGINQLTNVVEAVALAKPKFDLTKGAMIVSYDPDPQCSTGGTGGSSVIVNGSATVNLNGGGIYMNSDEVCGFKIPNCADLNITGGAGINSVGTVDNIDTGSCVFDPPLTEHLSQEPISIPEDVYWPAVPPECGFNAPAPTKLGEVVINGKSVEEWLIYPGFYADFPQAALVTNKSRIFMKSGVYCINPPMDQDLSWSPVDAVLLNGSISPSKNKHSSYNTKGVTIYIRAGGGFSLNANSPTYLDASTEGAYQGYLIVLEGTHTSIEDCTITGGAELDINGLIFAPYCSITVNGSSDSTAQFNAQVVGWDIKLNGTNTINFNYDPSNKVTIKAKVGLMK